MNAYGPAECADDVALCTLREPPGAEAVVVPIGRPTDNNRLYVLDGSLRQVAVGVIGEVCVAGVGVGLGVPGRPPPSKSGERRRRGVGEHLAIIVSLWSSKSHIPCPTVLLVGPTRRMCSQEMYAEVLNTSWSQNKVIICTSPLSY